jgi:O-antigen/teichoic acid export membrane protein
VARTADSDWRTSAIVRRGGLAVAIEVASSTLAIGLVVAIERTLPAGSLGIYGVASAVGIVLFIAGSLGTSQIIVREGATHRDEFAALSAASFRFRILFLVVIAGPTMLLSPSAVFGLLVLNAAANLFIDLSTAILRGLERYVAAGVAGVAYRAIALAVILVLGRSGDLTPVAIGLLVTTIVTGVASVCWAFSSARIRAAHHTVPVLVRTLRAYSGEALVLAAYQVAYGATSRLDVVLVGALAGIRASTGYVAAAVLGAGLANIGYTVVGFVLPRLSAVHREQARGETARIAWIGWISIAACAVPAMFLVDPVVDALYGSAPRLSATPDILRIFLAAFPFVVGARVLLAGFIATARPWRVLGVQVAGMVWLVAGVIVGYQIATLRGAAVGSASSDAMMLVLALAVWRVRAVGRASPAEISSRDR